MSFPGGELCREKAEEGVSSFESLKKRKIGKKSIFVKLDCSVEERRVCSSLAAGGGVEIPLERLLHYT